MDYSFLKEILSYTALIGVLAAIWFVVYKFGSTAVDVEIKDESIVLKTNKTILNLAPCLYISAGHKKKKLLSVGQEATPNEPYIKVHLLKYDDEVGGSKEYYEYVSAFFRFAFCKLINRRIFVLPKVSLKGAEKLSYDLNDTNNNSVYKAFRQAGAIECLFNNSH